MTPEKIGMVILVCLVLCAEVNSLRRIRGLRRFERAVGVHKGTR